jgi:hypothetical protein
LTSSLRPRVRTTTCDFNAWSLIAGLDAYDREEAKRHARQQAEQALNQSGQY